MARAAPRGHAKTMFNSNTYPIHELVFKKRQFILIISETANLSATLIRYIAEQLKYNEKLREDYGELLSPSKQLNDIDNNEMFETTTGALVRSGSIGKAIRGARNGGQRPDLIICDDLESMDNTNTPEAREKIFTGITQLLCLLEHLRRQALFTWEQWCMEVVCFLTY